MGGHTYGSCLYHFVFSTRNRTKLILPEWMNRLWDYMGGIARENGMKSLIAGGTENHCHIFMMIPPSMAPAKGIQSIKAGSSKWVNEEFAPRYRFQWQEGHGVFTNGFSQIETTTRYIRNQAEHHRKRTFEDEYKAFLKRHMIEYQEDYVFG